MPFTYVALVSGTDDASGTTLDASSALNVLEGDLLIAWAKFDGATTSIAVQKDSGGNALTFDAGDLIDAGGSVGGSLGYKIAAAADSSFTPRLTLGAARDFRRFIVMQFRPAYKATVTKDGSSDGTATSSSVSSGNFTTTGTDGVAVGASDQAPTSLQINGVGATEPSGVPVGGVTVWYRILSAPFVAGAATGSLGGSDLWICGAVAFKGERAWILSNA